MSVITKPMLASDQDEKYPIRFPVIASPKLDGIRCLKINGEVVSRKFLAIPNSHIRETLKELLPEGADGEIMVGDTFQDVTSGVMSMEGKPKFKYWMFDLVTQGLDEPYNVRLARARVWYKEASAANPLVKKYVRVVPSKGIFNKAQLDKYEKMCLKAKFEGVMVRSPNGPYKCGRATAKEGTLLKVKRFKDSEALILGFVEGQHNLNEATKDNLGRTKRSSSKEGKVPANTLGKFLVRDVKTGVEFECGTGEGLTHALRKEIWGNQGKYLGKIIKYKYQPHGVKEKPRLPIFLGFRDERDMS